jgi:hypothetical protein
VIENVGMMCVVVRDRELKTRWFCGVEQVLWGHQC